jgi:clostripain
MPVRSTFLIVLFALALALTGCGGGGGGGNDRSQTGTLVYRTDWTNNRAPIGESQRIALFRPDGSFVASQIMNHDQPGVQELSFSNLDQGKYVLTAQLFSQRNAAGVATGELESEVTVGNSTLFQTAVGDDVASVEVTPPSATVSTQQSIDFTATAKNAGGIAVFADPDSITWQSNANLTVDEDGLALGVLPGIGTVVASHTVSGFTDAAVVTVTQFSIQKKKWTVLVFLNAANDLNEFGDLNFNQMERVAGNPDVRFVVQWKQALISGVSNDPSFTGTRRYLVKKDTTSEVKSDLIQNMGEGVDMGDPQTMADFIDWGMTYFPADRYVVIVWNHGNGWRRSLATDNPTRGVSYDDETGNSINTWELVQAMSGKKVDILAWDASLMQMQEVAYQLRNNADYIVGSEESPPGAGYPYDTIFDNFEATPDLSTLSLAKNFVDATLAVPSYANQKITQSVLDTTKLAGVTTAMSALAQQLISQRNANPTGFVEYIQAARLNAQSYSPTSGRTYRDLFDLTMELDKSVAGYQPTAGILNANHNLRQAILAAVAHEGHNAQSPDSRGISVDFSNTTRYQTFATDYQLMQFAQAGLWDEWLAVAP